MYILDVKHISYSHVTLLNRENRHIYKEKKRSMYRKVRKTRASKAERHHRGT